MSEIKCINLGYVCSNAEAASVEEVFRKHAAWMTDFYSEANNGSEHLLNAYFTKAPEFIDPTDPEKGVTVIHYSQSMSVLPGWQVFSVTSKMRHKMITSLNLLKY